MAKANIRKVMAMLDPEECGRQYELPNLMARETFRLDRARVRNADELMLVCGSYYVHHFRRVMDRNARFSVARVRGEVYRILEHHFRGGVRGACTAAVRAINGALPGVLDCIRDWFLKDMEDHYFDHTVMECVDIMDLEDQETLMKQYLRLYGHRIDGPNLPSARFLATRFRDVLKGHARIVREMRTEFGR